MKRIIMIVASLVMILCIVCLTAGCNRQLIDTTYRYKKAIISLPNGDVVEGAVESWIDYADGDQIQVKINGKTYLVHSSDICLTT